MAMKNKLNPLADQIGLSVKEAVESGMKVRLPNLLDDFYLMQEDGKRVYDILWLLASEVSTKHDITHDEGRDIVVGSLTDLGVDLGENA
jgi:hypothetical protein